MSNLPTEISFLKDVANHEMTIRHDAGIYRSIRFSQPKTCNMYFDITTWPGFLCFSGDMGCYVFSRLTDMLEFFRKQYNSADCTLSINPSYWGEKVNSVDRNSGIMEYSEVKFTEAVKRYLDDAEASAEMRQRVTKEVLSRASDGEHEAMRAAMDFEHDGFRLDDFYEYSVRDYTYRFIWCCYAIAWAVKKYDVYKKTS